MWQKKKEETETICNDEHVDFIDASDQTLELQLAVMENLAEKHSSLSKVPMQYM